MTRRKVSSRDPHQHEATRKRESRPDITLDPANLRLIEYLRPLGEANVEGMVDVIQPKYLSATLDGIALHCFKVPITAKAYLHMTAKAARDLHQHGFITDWDGLNDVPLEEEAPASNTGPQPL